MQQSKLEKFYAMIWPNIICDRVVPNNNMQYSIFFPDRWANYLYSEDSIGAEVAFNHPYLQADAMFVGEFLCMGAFLVSLLCGGKPSKVSFYNGMSLDTI